ncbi:cobalamin/Fe3+-siderophores ABC transporter ATP-binding protein, partial [Haloferax sp. Atlit-6N]
FSERNYAGDAGRAVYERLRDRGHVVSSSELLSTVGELACESFRERSREMKDDTDTSDVEGDADETDSGFDDSPYHSNQS